MTQSRSIEALEADLRTAPPGTARIDLLNDLSAMVSSDNPARALELAREAHHAAEEMQYTSGLIKACFTAAKCEMILLSPDDSLRSFQKSLFLSEEIEDPQSIIRSLIGIANVYSRTGKFADALENFLRGLRLCEMTDDIVNTRIIKGNLGVLYSQLGDFPLALHYHKENLQLARQIGNSSALAHALNGIGVTYMYLCDYTGALPFLVEGASLALEGNMNHIYYLCLGNIGNVYGKLGNFSSALEYFLQALKKTEEIQDGIGRATCMFHIGTVYEKLGNTSNAMNYYLKSFAIFERAQDHYGGFNVLQGIAGLFHTIGDFDNALSYALKALDMCKTLGSRDGEAQVLCQIGNFYRTKQDSTTALLYLTQALEIAESINAQEILVDLHTALTAAYKQTGDTARSKHHAKEQKKLSLRFFNETDRKEAFQLIQQFEKEQAQREAQISNTHLPDQSMTAELLSLTGKIQARGLSLASDIRFEPEITATSGIREISVKTFGRFAVMLNGRELTPEDWQRKKARDIFKVLLIHYRKLVSTDELIELLWQDGAGKNLIPTIWNSISYIRKALEPDLKPQMPSSYIKIVKKSYMLDLGDEADIDFLRFKELLEQSRKASDSSSRIHLLEQAVELYDGEFLKEDMYEEWSCFERESLKESYLEILLQLARDWHDHHEDDKALLVAGKAIETDRTYEEAYEIIFHILRNRNQTAEAQKVMKQCREAFLKELGCPPPNYLERMISSPTSRL